VHLVGFTIEMYYDARSYKRQTRYTRVLYNTHMRGRHEDLLTELIYSECGRLFCSAISTTVHI